MTNRGGHGESGREGSRAGSEETYKPCCRTGWHIFGKKAPTVFYKKKTSQPRKIAREGNQPWFEKKKLPDKKKICCKLRFTTIKTEAPANLLIRNIVIADNIKIGHQSACICFIAELQPKI